MTEKEQTPVADRSDHKFTLRLTEGLHAVIEDSSNREGRSMNTEILLRLARTVEAEEVVQVRVARNNLSVIEFLADSVQELAVLLTEEQRESDRVKTILDFSRKFTSAGVPK
jgi:hypothetical protein